MSQYLDHSTKASLAGLDADEAPSLGFAEARSLKRELLDELRASREENLAVRPEDLLPRWPSDPKADPDVASLLFEDFQQRRQRGEEPSASEYEERFPEHRDSLAGLFRHDAVLRSLTGVSGSSGASLALPGIGEELFGFRLIEELGRGAFARVFLAEQADLAGRPVVLKVSGIDGNEPQTLAQLQHTHIVPIYSVHEDARAGLRAVCMPYFGGASLSRVLESLWAETALPGRGEQLVIALSEVRGPVCDCQLPETVGQAFQPDRQADRQAGKPDLLPATNHGPIAALVDMTYVQAVAWLVLRLAEAVQHAHERGVLHRDIKPSNILLSAAGEPMLLDFNLSQNVRNGQAQAAATLGGTVAYMAPEHLRALAARDPALVRLVDQRADIYSLGMVLYEMLLGHRPFDQSASYAPLPALIEAMAVERGKTVPSLRGQRADVPWSLESIARKCLAPDQSQRYQRAEDLAEDLRRFLDDRPLKHAPELSRVERVQKWARRHPRLTYAGLVAGVATVLLGVAGAAYAGVHAHLESTQAELADAGESLAKNEARVRRDRYEKMGTRALCLLNTTDDLRDHLPQGLAALEEALGLYGILDREDWQEHPDWQRLDADERQRLAEDTRELLMLLAWAEVRKQPRDLEKALRWLDRAERIHGLEPSPALWQDRALYLEQMNDAVGAKAARAMAEALPPVSARDHYLLALSHAHNNQKAEALAELDQALRLNPRHYWSWVQRGICHLDLGKYSPAAGDFGRCISLEPDLAWGHFNLGYALFKSGNRAEAIDSYTAALKCDPAFVLAAWNRGLARRELARHAEALADFDKAAELGQDDWILHFERGLALEQLARPAEADRAFASAFARAEAAADGDWAGIRLRYGFAVYQRLPNEADKRFVAVLQRDDKNLQALYGRAMVLVRQAKSNEAIRAFDQALEINPGFVDARRFRAVLLARHGRFAEAEQDIQWCLVREPQAGITLYAAACVAALAAQKSHPGNADQAIDFLQGALDQGYGHDLAAADPDLKSLHDHPKFQELLRKREWANGS